MKTIIKRFVRLLIGLCVMSFGSAMALVADLGMEPMGRAQRRHGKVPPGDV